MWPVEIWNTCVLNLKVPKVQIKFSIVSKTAIRIIASKLFCKCFGKNRNQPLSIFCSLCLVLFFFNNTFSNIPASHQHCTADRIIRSILADSNHFFNIRSYWLIRNKISFYIGVLPSLSKLFLIIADNVSYVSLSSKKTASFHPFLYFTVYTQISSVKWG